MYEVEPAGCEVGDRNRPSCYVMAGGRALAPDHDHTAPSEPKNYHRITEKAAYGCSEGFSFQVSDLFLPSEGSEAAPIVQELPTCFGKESDIAPALHIEGHPLLSRFVKPTLHQSLER